MQEDVTHAEIYARLIAVENKVDTINQHTQDVVEAFNETNSLDWCIVY